MKLKSVAVWCVVLGGLALFLFFAFQSTATRGIDVGDVVGDLGLTNMQGEAVDLADWRGQGIMLRLSSSSCTSCPFDFPLLDQWQAELGEDVQVIAVQVGDSPAGVRALLRGESPGVPIILDETTEAAKRLGLRQVPAVYFITSRGTLSSVSHVEVGRTDVLSHVRLMLAGGPNIERDVRDVSSQLQCQECQGRSIWESDSRSSIELREYVRSLLLAGLRPDEVVETIASEYGEWMLLVPPTRGVASLAWVLPIAAAFTGLGTWLILLGRARRRRADVAEGTVDPKADEIVKEKKARLARRIDDYM